MGGFRSYSGAARKMANRDCSAMSSLLPTMRSYWSRKSTGGEWGRRHTSPGQNRITLTVIVAFALLGFAVLGDPADYWKSLAALYLGALTGIYVAIIGWVVRRYFL